MSTRRALLTFGGLMALLVACPICVLGVEFGRTEIGTAFALALAAGGVIIFRIRHSSPARKALDQHRASLKAEFADEATQKLIEERFSRQNKHGYLVLRAERQALIQTTFSSLADNRLVLT